MIRENMGRNRVHKPEAQAKGVRKYYPYECPSLALQACCKRRACAKDTSPYNAPSLATSGLLQAKGVRKYISLQIALRLEIQACCKRRACEDGVLTMPFRLHFRLVASEGRAKIHILTMPFACSLRLVASEGRAKIHILTMPFACASGLLQATSPASFAFSTAIDLAL